MRPTNQSLVADTTLAASLAKTTVEVDPKASVKDTATSIQGINHIGLSVRDLDKTLSFYQRATGFELLSRELVTDNADANKLFGAPGLEYEQAVIKAPNMLFELIAFEHNRDSPVHKMPVQGPGMTHTCFPSSASDPGYDKFVAAGLDVLSRGSSPVDLGGYGVTYAYGYDPEGNMLEMEQMDKEILARSGYDSAFQDLGYPMWMTQVALVTHDIKRLMSFYQMVLGFSPYNVGEYKNHPQSDKVVNVDNAHVKGCWFRMDSVKVIELWQYENPRTPAFSGQREVTAPGYSFSIEVGNIQREYQRLKELGVAFVSEPVLLDNLWQAYAFDVDGNVFSLRQPKDT
ncbi:VOC family protein [Exilibacterium tricleocarpae]|uniref:VOC family protein n=1 Tax=Exilibacterium tricleocarpae TaxID=2591008 RepID=A0A545TBF6_9GAMM|nr:VOC family protein [Exilibacterium tricleocarpae]TQV74545.1 VOC family protein [Exilibacterium tricleocarpae]